MKIKVLLPMVVMLCVLPLVGFLCDVGVNPLLFDGSPLTAKITVNSGSQIFADSVTVNVADAVSAIDKDIDSVNLFNITLRIVRIGNAPADNLLSGDATFNGSKFLSLSNVGVDAFSTDQSVFHLPSGVTMNRQGMRQIVRAIWAASRHQTSDSAVVKIAGTSTKSPNNYTIYLNLYTQVFTPPPNK
jgi:hypothetical protein